MTEMREIVDLRTVDAAIKIGGAAWLAAALLIGALLMVARRSGSGPLVRGAFLSLIGPLLVGLWLLYQWMVRYDPESGYFGLNKVWVLAVNALLFVVVGSAYGYLLGRLWERTAREEASPPEPAKDG
jgi:hypothetical protein